MNIIFKFLFLFIVLFFCCRFCFVVACHFCLSLSLIACHCAYQPPPNADPNDPPNISFAAMGPNDSVPGLAAPTKGVESC